MTLYTTPNNLPILETSDKIASSTDGLLLDINALSLAASTAITAEGARAEDAANVYASDKDIANRAAWAAADTARLNEAKAYADEQIALAKTAVAWDKGVLAADWNTVQSSGRWTVNDVTLPNRAVAVSGELESAWGSTTGVHRFTTREDNPRVFYRRYTAGAFTAWGKGETGARLDAIEGAKYVPEWKPATAYAINQKVVAPNGDVVSAKAAFTSGASYSATNWNASTQDGRVAALEAAKWQKTFVASGVDLDTIKTAGVYPVNYTNHPGQPFASAGTLEVVPSGTGTTWTHRFTTRETVPREAVRITAVTGWWPWLIPNTEARLTAVEAAKYSKTFVAQGIDLDTIKTAGVYPVTYTDHPNQPFPFAGSLEVLPSGVGTTWTHRFTTREDPPREAKRITSVSGWWGWNVTGAAPPAPAATVDNGPYQRIMRANDMRRRRFNRVTAPGVAVLVLDHGLTNFKSIVWPLLQARGIPVTLALNPGQMAQAQNSGATYADVKAWAATGLVEPANHSYNHIGGASSAELDTEIRASRVELETQLAQTIDTWVHPGNTFGDFTITADPNLYWNTEAGRMILANHGAVTGILTSGTLPLGMNSIGAGGIWLDTDGSAAGTQAAITGSETAGGIRIVRLHPQFLNDAGKLTTAELTSFLDWLKAEQDAGRLKVLTFRDAMSATR